MKHTDIFVKIGKLKSIELKELIAAVKAHGGYVEFDKDKRPCVALSGTSFISHPFDVYIKSIQLDGNGELLIIGEDFETGDEMRGLCWDDFAVGQIAEVIGEIPETEEVNDVTTK